jgi:hypothetical protein
MLYAHAFNWDRESSVTCCIKGLHPHSAAFQKCCMVTPSFPRSLRKGWDSTMLALRIYKNIAAYSLSVRNRAGIWSAASSWPHRVQY